MVTATVKWDHDKCSLVKPSLVIAMFVSSGQPKHYLDDGTKQGSGHDHIHGVLRYLVKDALGMVISDGEAMEVSCAELPLHHH